MIGMTSTNAILESVGINHAALAAQVKERRQMTDAGLAPGGHYSVEALACALEQLASRLAGIADDASRNLGDFYLDDMARDVIDMVNDGGKDPHELVRAHLGLDASQPLLPSSPVFGRPELRCVNHLVPDHAQGRFTLTSYLVDVHSGDVTPAPGGPAAVGAAGA